MYETCLIPEERTNIAMALKEVAIPIAFGNCNKTGKIQ
jgi:hypothetical protein